MPVAKIFFELEKNPLHFILIQATLKCFCFKQWFLQGFLEGCISIKSKKRVNVNFKMISTFPFCLRVKYIKQDSKKWLKNKGLGYLVVSKYILGSQLAVFLNSLKKIKIFKPLSLALVFGRFIYLPFFILYHSIYIRQYKYKGCKKNQ